MRAQPAACALLLGIGTYTTDAAALSRVVLATTSDRSAPETAYTLCESPGRTCIEYSRH